MAAASKRNFIVEAEYPTQRLIEVSPSPLRSEVIAVLCKRRSAADFWQIVDGFAVSKCTQKVEAVTGMFLGFQLQRMIGRVRDVRNRCESTELRERPSRLHIPRPRYLNLI